MRAVRLTLLAAALAVWGGPVPAAERVAVLPAPALDEPATPGANAETVVLAGGCFWGVQGVFQHLNGVTRAVSGYAGGGAETANYETVGTGATGHAESVEVTFEPAVVSYGAILRVFFSVAHDPTERDRQGADVGTQYRSAVFTVTEGQRRITEAYIAQLDKAGAFPRPIATKVGPLEAFYPAEPYHQDYATRHPENPYIRYTDLPKIEALKRVFPERYRPAPVLVN